MKTILPESITTVEQAKKFLSDLNLNGELYHPEGDAHEVHWATATPTPEECDKLNSLMNDIYNLPGNDGRHCGEMIFDPCEYCLSL